MHPSALRGALVCVVQATQDRDGAYRPRAARRRSWLRLGQGLAEALVRSCPVEEGDVLAEHPAEMALTEDEQVVQAFAPHAAQEALADGVRPRRAVWRAQDRDAAG